MDSPQAENLRSGRKQSDLILGSLQEFDRFIPWVSPFSLEEFTEHVREFLIRLYTSEIA